MIIKREDLSNSTVNPAIPNLSLTKNPHLRYPNNVDAKSSARFDSRNSRRKEASFNWALFLYLCTYRAAWGSPSGLPVPTVRSVNPHVALFVFDRTKGAELKTVGRPHHAHAISAPPPYPHSCDDLPNNSREVQS